MHGKLNIFKAIKTTQGLQSRDISYVQEGKDFGKIELYNYCKRLSNVQCTSDCCVLYLDKASHQNLLRPFHIQQINKLLGLLLNLKQFECFSLNSLLNLIPLLAFRIYPSNFVLYKEGYTPKEIYFILQGEFRMTKSEELVQPKAKQNLQMLHQKLQQNQKTLPKTMHGNCALSASGSQIVTGAHDPPRHSA